MAVLRAQRPPVPQRPVLGEQPAPERWAAAGHGGARGVANDVLARGPADG